MLLIQIVINFQKFEICWTHIVWWLWFPAWTYFGWMSFSITHFTLFIGPLFLFGFVFTIPMFMITWTPITYNGEIFTWLFIFSVFFRFILLLFRFFIFLIVDLYRRIRRNFFDFIGIFIRGKFIFCVKNFGG